MLSAPTRAVLAPVGGPDEPVVDSDSGRRPPARARRFRWIMPQFDIALNNARDEGGHEIHVGVDDGVVTIRSALPVDGRRSFDCKGGLLSRTLIEPHIHLDKCLVDFHAERRTDLRAYLAQESIYKRRRATDEIYRRASAVMDILLNHGVTTITSQVDVDSAASLSGMEALVRLRDDYADRAQLRIVAFPQLGIIGDRGSMRRLRTALSLGADAVGGHPQLEDSAHDSEQHIVRMFDLAEAFDVAIDMHCDESDSARHFWIESVLDEIDRRSWRGSVSVAHLNTMDLMAESRRSRIIDRLRAHRIRVICNPTSAMMFRGSPERLPHRRAIPPARRLIDRGIHVSLGQETYKSVFISNLRYPHPLLSAQVFAFAAQFRSDNDMRTLWSMLTGQGGAVPPGDGIPQVGEEATLNVWPHATIEANLAHVARPVLRLYRGSVLPDYTERTDERDWVIPDGG